MRTIPVAEFKDNASAYIAAAEAGEEIVVTRHGKPAARIVPPSPASDDEASFDAAWDRLMEQRERMRAEGRTATIEELIAWKNEGRR